MDESVLLAVCLPRRPFVRLKAGPCVLDQEKGADWHVCAADSERNSAEALGWQRPLACALILDTQCAMLQAAFNSSCNPASRKRNKHALPCRQ